MAADGASNSLQENGVAPPQNPTLLPPGWWVKNANGSFVGPRIRADDQDDAYYNSDDEQSSDAESQPDASNLDIEPDSDGWEDTGSPDVEAVVIHCLLCAQSFSEVTPMLDHCRGDHNFDLIQAIRNSKFDYYTSIKYINFIRRNVLDGVDQPTVIPNTDDLKNGREDLLRPVLEDDALLYMIDDAVDFEAD